MHAIRFHTHGGPEVLTYEEVPDPQAGPGEALVRVRACALNHLDIWERRGIERVKIPLPHISGSDVAGEVVWADAPEFPPGTRVLLQPGVSCGRCAACLSGRDNLCPTYTALGYLNDGGYAELVTVPLANLVPIPDHIDFTAAAAFPLTFLTAWHMLMTLARIQPGETVLVLGAGSGVGQAAIQLAARQGTRVIATAGTDEKLARARDLGAHETINHTTEDIAKVVRAITNKRGADVVFEHVGQATWDKSVLSLARGGRLVTCGATTGAAATIDLRLLFGRQISLIGSYMGSKGELLRVVPLFFAGEIQPVVDSVFPLKAAADAQRRLEDRMQFGKIVLEV